MVCPSSAEEGRDMEVICKDDTEDIIENDSNDDSKDDTEYTIDINCTGITLLCVLTVLILLFVSFCS